MPGAVPVGHSKLLCPQPELAAAQAAGYQGTSGLAAATTWVLAGAKTPNTCNDFHFVDGRARNLL